MTLKIAIIGAGPAGCLLARLLQQSQQPIDLTIFESEASLNFRSQGGSLDLHDDTGLAALSAANLFDAFKQHARYDGEAMKIADKNLLCYFNQGARTKSAITGRPEIDRPRLRELLFNSLAEGTVKWEHKLHHVGEDLTLHFANGVVASGYDLIVGADGGWSHVRARLTDTKPLYSGIGGHAFTMPDAESKHPDLHALVNRGTLFAWSDGKAIMAQQMGDGSLNVGVWSVRSEDWMEQCGHDVHDPTAVKEAVREEFQGWDERLLRFVMESEGEVAPRSFWMLPVGMRWEHVRGVTLVGDAAHLMTPFAGEGVNAAFTDSWKLSQSIISSLTTNTPLDPHLHTFEQEMFVRAQRVQELTYDMMTFKFFHPGSPRTAIEKYILRALRDKLGWGLSTFVVGPMVWTWFGVFKMIW